MVEKLKKIVKEFADHLSPDALEIDIVEEGGVYKISAQTKDTITFIGKDNERFEAFSHLLKRMLSKILGEDSKIIIDINSLRGRNDDALKAKASILAERARAFKKDIELDPMSSYERRVIHAHLEGAPLVKTESVGHGSSRRLVIRYTEIKDII